MKVCFCYPSHAWKLQENRSVSFYYETELSKNLRTRPVKMFYIEINLFSKIKFQIINNARHCFNTVRFFSGFTFLYGCKTFRLNLFLIKIKLNCDDWNDEIYPKIVTILYYNATPRRNANQRLANSLLIFKLKMSHHAIRRRITMPPFIKMITNTLCLFSTRNHLYK